MRSPLGFHLETNVGNNWLYYTLIISSYLVFSFVIFQIDPTAYPGFLGIAIVFISKSFFAEVYKNVGIGKNAQGFVSWKNTTHLFPIDIHFFGN